MITVSIGGDVCPIGKNLPYFISGDAESIFNDLLMEFEKADLSIVNLECPLINENTPIAKIGPILGVPGECINGIKQANIDILNLANNHIMDHGPTGLKNTLKVCAEAQIKTVGAGENLEQARRILIQKIDNIRIGIMAFAEHEFSIATYNSWGASPLDLIDFVRNVRSQKDNFDYLIVLLHGGNEQYPFPSPRLIDTCRFMVEMGADAVIVQHTHCPGCYEEYQNAHIVYGQGNLIFDWPCTDEAFYKGFLVKLSIAGDLSSTMDIIPYTQSNSHIGARKMDHEGEQLLRQSLQERSLAIKDSSFVLTQWLKFCEVRKYDYLSKVLGFNRLYSKLNQNGFIVKYFYTTKSLIRTQNIILCESHREVIETILNYRMI